MVGLITMLAVPLSPLSNELPVNIPARSLDTWAMLLSSGLEVITKEWLPDDTIWRGGQYLSYGGSAQYGGSSLRLDAANQPLPTFHGVNLVDTSLVVFDPFHATRNPRDLFFRRVSQLSQSDVTGFGVCRSIATLLERRPEFYQTLQMLQEKAGTSPIKGFE